VRPNSPQIESALIGVLLGVGACAVAILASTEGSWPVIVLATAPLIVRAAWQTMPLWLLLVTTTVPIMVAEAIENQPASATWLIGCVALVTAAIDRRRQVEFVPIAFVVGGPLWLRLTGTVEYDGAIFGIWTMGLLLSATLGTIVGQQRRLITTMREAQANLATAAAADERHRIARDLHDIVGHSFSVVLLHLAGARHVMRTDPAGAEAALRQAEDVGRRGMDDLRASLALLRSTDDSYTPVGDLGALHGLVDGMRQAGLDITYSSAGDLDDVDAAVAVVIYSVAREALTNAAKHAAEGPITCEVEVGDRAVLRVVNPTRPGTTTRPKVLTGHGLAGMSERVHAIGGSLDVDQRGNSWTVLLDVPARGLQAVR
jgi:signal transduction histidine kinase